MWTRGNLINHRPREGNLFLILQVVEECGRNQSVFYPALGVGKYASLNLVAIVRAVVHALHGEWQLSGVETLKQQGTNLAHSEYRLKSASQIGFVVCVTLLGDGERNHLQTWVLEDFNQTVPVLKLRVGLQSLGYTGDYLLLNRTI